MIVPRLTLVCFLVSLDKWLRNIAAIVLLSFGMLSCASLPDTGTEQLEFESSGLRRTHLLHTPTAAPSEKKLPLVVMLPGALLTARASEHLTNFSKIADRGKFYVLYPNAARGRFFTWNLGQHFNLFEKLLGEVNAYPEDVEYVKALIEYVEQTYSESIDPERIYLVGLSMGAALAHQLAAKDHENRFAGLAMVSGGAPILTGECSTENCKCDVVDGITRVEPIPTMIVRGTCDPVIPYESCAAGVKPPNWNFAGAQCNADAWACRNGAKKPSDSGENANIPDMEYVEARYLGDIPEQEVRLVTIERGGHHWYGSPRWFWKPFLCWGRDPRTFDTSESIWSFFSEVSD